MSRSMKDSGIEWLDNIPCDWEVIKLKYFCDITTGNKDTINRNDDGEYPFFVRSPIVERIDTYAFDGEAILTAGDGVGAGKVFHHFIGKFDYHQRVYNLYNFKGVNGKYLYYYLKENFQKEIEKGNAKSTVDSIRLPMLKEFPVLKQPIDIQDEIVSYLDKKVTEIENILSKTRESIEEYKKYKQSLITETVTKGLNSNVKMKDSSVEWIGEIPEHWDILKLKYLFNIKKDIAGELGYDVLSVTQTGLKIKDINSNEGQQSMDYSKYQLVDPDDFVMNHMDLLTGWVDCSVYQGVTSPDYRVFKLIDVSKNSKEYYKYIFQMCYLNRIFYGLGQGVSNLGRWRLQTDKFINFQLPVPPTEEQIKIAEKVGQIMSDIDEFTNKKYKLITELESYKKSLIYEVVTGKKEV